MRACLDGANCDLGFTVRLVGVVNVGIVQNTAEIYPACMILKFVPLVVSIPG